MRVCKCVSVCLCVYVCVCMSVCVCLSSEEIEGDGRRETNETERRRERERERERERKGGIKREEKGNGEPLESCGPAFTPLPGTLHTPETLFTQQPRRRGSLRSYLLRARLATRC